MPPFKDLWDSCQLTHVSATGVARDSILHAPFTLQCTCSLPCCVVAACLSAIYVCVFRVPGCLSHAMTCETSYQIWTSIWIGRKQSAIHTRRGDSHCVGTVVVTIVIIVVMTAEAVVAMVMLIAVVGWRGNRSCDGVDGDGGDGDGGGRLGVDDLFVVCTLLSKKLIHMLDN